MDTQQLQDFLSELEIIRQVNRYLEHNQVKEACDYLVQKGCVQAESAKQSFIFLKQDYNLRLLNYLQYASRLNEIKDQIQQLSKTTIR
ncbi:MAG: hypothetical protein ACRDBG_14245 [Waterburya sp.]